MGLSNRELLAFAPLPVVMTVLAVLVMMSGMNGNILFPEQLPGDPFLLQLLVDEGEVRLGGIGRIWTFVSWLKALSQLGVAQIRQWPGELGCGCGTEIFVDDSNGES